MKALKKFRAGTALDNAGKAGQPLIAVLSSGIANAVNDNVFTFEKLSDLLKTLEDDKLAIDPDKAGKGPLSQLAFYDDIRAGRFTTATAREQLAKVREENEAAKEQGIGSILTEPVEALYNFSKRKGLISAPASHRIEDFYHSCKREAGFLSSRFNIFADKDPLEKAVSNVVEFDRYCKKNGIGYGVPRNESAYRLVQGEKPKTGLDYLKEWRFALAAAAGIALGASGMNLDSGAGITMPGFNEHITPILSQTPGWFFSKGLPWLGGAFISLNIYKAFTEHSVRKEIGTLGRFAAITSIGFGVSYLTTIAMTSLLSPVDPSIIPVANIGNGGGPGAWSPMAAIPQIAAGMTAAAIAYKGIKKIADKFNEAARKTVEEGQKLSLVKQGRNLIFNSAVGVGKTGIWAAKVTSKAFPAFINVVGIPAVATLLSSTMYNGGIGQLALYGNYYLSMFAGLAAGTAVLAGGFAALGYGNRRDMGQVMSAAKEGFFISSSSATLPKEKKCLIKMGVSEKAADSVLPLAGVFSMFGTAMYLGQTAFYSLNMFNSDPTGMQYLKTAMATFTIAMGAPGIPASNIALLDPVMQQTGVSQVNINKMYTMILPMDRPLDMAQTGMNVMGDMIAAADKDACDKGGGSVGLARRLKNRFLKTAGMQPRAPAEPAVIQTPPASQAPPKDHNRATPG